MRGRTAIIPTAENVCHEHTAHLQPEVLHQEADGESRGVVGPLMVIEAILFGLVGLLGYIVVCTIAGAIVAVIVNLVLIVLEEAFNLVLDVGTLIFRIPMYMRGTVEQEENVSL